MSSLTEYIYEKAKKLPPRDAAFDFWRYKSSFDSEELPPRPVVDTTTPEALQRFNESFEKRWRHEREFAHEGVTFDRMKRVYPHARATDLQDAIKAAVKLESDCSRYFDRNFTDLEEAAAEAVAKARRENPGFLDDTYLSAENYLLYLWK
jgi:hypothetical protein